MSEERSALPLGERRLSERHKTLLQRKYGIPPELAERAGLFTVPDGDGVYRLTGARPRSGKGGIAIPYPGEPDGYVRIRLDEPEGGMKYVSPRRGGCRLYVPPGADLAAPEVVITEGELKALCAAARGINCVAVAGIDSWRQRGPLGERLPEAEALLGRLRRDWRGQTAVLVYDSDIGPSHERYDAFPRLAEQLYRLGADLVKVVTLPPLDAAPGEKVGLDDFVLKYERAGEDGAERLRALLGPAPPWLPVGDGARPFAERILADPGAPLEKVKLALAALVASTNEAEARRALDARFADRTMRAAVWRDAKGVLEEALRRQGMRDRAGGGRRGRGGEEPERHPRPTLADAFPPAAGAPFGGFPVPEGYEIRPDGRIVRVSAKLNSKTGGADYQEKQVSPCFIALASRLIPADGEADDTRYEIWWYPGAGEPRRRQIPAGILFNHKRAEVLMNMDVPVDSLRAAELVGWLSTLRDMAYPTGGGARLPERIVVSRSGWHKPPEGAELFAVGRDVYTAAGRKAGEAGAAADDADPDDPLTEWSDAIGANERQLLDAIRAGGSYERQLEAYLRWLRELPMAAFFAGAGAAAPLVRTLVEAGESEVCGFVVESTHPESGRGKTTLNMFAAGLWGKPAVGEMIRTANRTTMASEILFSVHCDISTHIDESQLIRFGDAIAEIVYSLALGMGRERGAKHGGGRRTRRFYTVVVVSAERSVLDVVGARQGVFDRVLSFPPLFPAKREEYRRMAERIQRELNEDYGHLGRRYVEWLVSMPPERRKEAVLEAYGRWKRGLDEAADRLVPDTGDPADGSAERNQTLKRLAKRAAACLAGLELLLRACGLPQAEIAKITAPAAKAAWKHLADNATGQAFLQRVLDVLRSFVAENRELIDGLRRAEGRPPRWVGKKVLGKDGAEYVALFPNAVRDALKRYADAEYETAVRALRDAGLLHANDDRKRNGLRVRLNGVLEWCLAVRADAVADPETLAAGKGKEEEDGGDF